MPPVPKKKHTKARTGKRRNAPSKRVRLPNLVQCKNCKKLKPMNVACPHCGYYK